MGDNKSCLDEPIEGILTSTKNIWLFAKWLKITTLLPVRHPSSRCLFLIRCPPFSKIFFLKSLDQTKCHVMPHWEGGTKDYINGLGHMTMIAVL